VGEDHLVTLQTEGRPSTIGSLLDAHIRSIGARNGSRGSNQIASVIPVDLTEVLSS
jgi:hypothetical protein